MAQMEAHASLIDIGANLSHPAFERDLPQVLQRARDNGVARIVVTGADADSSEQALMLARAEPDLLYATAGLHPHHAADCSADLLDQLRSLARTPEVLAIGEAGLDFNRNLASTAQQRFALERQLELAADIGLPLFLHERDAAQPMLELLRAHRDQLGNAVIHCFTGDRDALFGYLDLDLHIGLTGWLCDPRRGTHLHPLLPEIPRHRLMIETDAPYLLPRDLPPGVVAQSSRNEPCALPHILRAVATAAGRPQAELALETSATAERFFAFAAGAG